MLRGGCSFAAQSSFDALYRRMSFSLTSQEGWQHTHDQCTVSLSLMRGAGSQVARHSRVLLGGGGTSSGREFVGRYGWGYRSFLRHIVEVVVAIADIGRER